MGVFGTGLYSGDFALDLRTAIRAVSRLPFGGDQLLDLLRKMEPEAAENSTDSDRSTFWLVIADQFAKRGIRSDIAREKAIEIIDRGIDLAILSDLGMTPRDLRKREKVLQDLRARLGSPIAEKPRPTLKRPQSLLMDIGDVLIYPTSRGRALNSYLPSRDAQFAHDDGKPWTHDGWGAITIIDAARRSDSFRGIGR